jgi:hypothetical protein
MVSIVEDLLAASFGSGALSADANDLAPLQPQHEPVHVLLADDDELSQKIVSALLEKNEYTGAHLRRCGSGTRFDQPARRPASVSALLGPPIRNAW